ncbi:hypothetical protein HNR02_002738 [Amycolatopsis endophytica]|uniref:Uncharacterized protein n=1 Tax=Amycolatopsis endophytica TaxID=860233 RepID=A0A853B3K9_9PSEU|nr:hypothetical protein [Amycolatopsis endophytica]
MTAAATGSTGIRTGGQGGMMPGGGGSGDPAAHACAGWI